MSCSSFSNFIFLTPSFTLIYYMASLAHYFILTSSYSHCTRVHGMFKACFGREKHNVAINVLNNELYSNHQLAVPLTIYIFGDPSISMDIATKLLTLINIFSLEPSRHTLSHLILIEGWGEVCLFSGKKNRVHFW